VSTSSRGYDRVARHSPPIVLLKIVRGGCLVILSTVSKVTETECSSMHFATIVIVITIVI